jgi:hypothetical protein
MHLHGYKRQPSACLDVQRVIIKLYARLCRNRDTTADAVVQTPTGFHVNKDSSVYYYVHLCQAVRLVDIHPDCCELHETMFLLKPESITNKYKLQINNLRHCDS